MKYENVAARRAESIDSRIFSDTSGSTAEGRVFRSPPRLFLVGKRGIDLVIGIGGLSVVGLVALGLTVANRKANPGPLFFRQKRMGKDGRPFIAWKFRTMTPDDGRLRGYADGLEEDRITPLGAWLRKTRLDETPQFINVLRGEMSVVGPRPDVYEHACAYSALVPGYRERYRVRPGITGHAQTRMGYAEGPEMTRIKTRKDHVYLRRLGCWRTEVAILRRTVAVMRTGFGAK